MHTVEPWPAFEEGSPVSLMASGMAFTPAFQAGGLCATVTLSLVDYMRAKVCVNACRGASSDSLQAIGLGYGEAVEQVLAPVWKRLGKAIEGLDEAMEIIGPIQGCGEADDSSELDKSIRRLKELSAELKRGV